jgi:cytochrome d ubiquinol oxidase subunit II
MTIDGQRSFKLAADGTVPMDVMSRIPPLNACSGIIKTLLADHYIRGIWFTGFGTTIFVFSLFLVAGYNHTAYYPSTFDLQSSLTIANSSSSKYTLVAMSYVSLFVPFVIAYISYAWKSMSREKMTSDELETSSHVY